MGEHDDANDAVRMKREGRQLSAALLTAAVRADGLAGPELLAANQAVLDVIDRLLAIDGLNARNALLMVAKDAALPLAAICRAAGVDPVQIAEAQEMQRAIEDAG